MSSDWSVMQGATVSSLTDRGFETKGDKPGEVSSRVFSQVPIAREREFLTLAGRLDDRYGFTCTKREDLSSSEVLVYEISPGVGDL